MLTDRKNCAIGASNASTSAWVVILSVVPPPGAGRYRSVTVPKSGCPVLGHSDVNSSVMCSITNGVSVGVGKVSRRARSMEGRDEQAGV